ncbi:hypothetical protein TRFO_31603 [Tritrichomonas foetus]|uniref:Uncharacterized protein n=1 Tax=Tritrichomonas foetus TaxID=1144522 RepID=A0A1J4JRX9_9EUKA|nr:hypothetical protein TRFO_31603 [Tritrichomonas foetus]|eukprot:OHT01514.1 hypothetical protein TRFO_31603 [Tritrichomonas foetus]
MKSVIDDISEFDGIYRSDGPGYVQFRKYFLKKQEKSLNVKFRQNTYLPLRILLLETTRNKAKHSLNDLWMLLHTRRMKTPAILSIPTDDVEPILWHKACPTLNAPGPISSMHFAPTSTEKFAYSTLDGSLHFATILEDQLRPNGRISVPSVAFLKFEWVSDNLIIGFGVTTSAYILCGETRICELVLPSPPSEVIKYPNSEAVAIIGSHNGHLFSVDLSELSVGETAAGFRQNLSSATLSKFECEVTRFHNAKKSISALAAVKGSESIICGTSDGDIDILSIEPKVSRKRGKIFTELKLKSSIRISGTKFTNSPKSCSVDALSMILIENNEFIFYNTRNEMAALLAIKENSKHPQLVKNYRVPSLRAKCPCAINNFRGNWVWCCGTDMGDLIVCDKDEEPTILTMHESSIASIEFVPNAHMFLAADVSGLISFWAKTEIRHS